MDIETSLNGFAALGARWVLWLLVGLSIAGLAVILERIVFLLSTRDRPEALRNALLDLLAQGDLDKARRRFEESPSAEARIVAAGMACATAGEAEERMAAETQRQRIRLQERLAYLGTLGNNAPFIGLLGTVIGIIGAFRELDAASGRISSGLMTEIGEALIATAVGLLVALPAIAAFNGFQRVIQVRLAQGDALGRELLAHLARTRTKEGA